MSCQKKSGSAPEIEFLNPFDTERLDLSEAISVSINIWDDINVEKYEIQLKSETGLEYFREEKLVNKDFHHVIYDFDLSSAQYQNFNITIWVTDNDGNLSKSSILVNSNK